MEFVIDIGIITLQSICHVQNQRGGGGGGVKTMEVVAVTTSNTW